MAWSTSVKIVGLDSFKKGLSELELNQYPFAMRNALNAISTQTQKAEQTQIVKDFDRPTPFTVNALRINYATKTKLQSGVVFKDPPRLSDSQHYLYHNVYGVKRGYKKFEAALYARGLMPAGYYAVPGKGVTKDAYGNIPASLIVQILSWFGANQNAGYTSASTDKTKAKKKNGTRNKFGFEYFSIRKKTGKLLPGIYKRTFIRSKNSTGNGAFNFGTSTQSIFIFVPKNMVGYQKSYGFYETANEVFRLNFKIHFDNEMKIALRTAFL
jgi:hypothetical protein